MSCLQRQAITLMRPPEFGEGQLVFIERLAVEIRSTGLMTFQAYARCTQCRTRQQATHFEVLTRKLRRTREALLRMLHPSRFHVISTRFREVGFSQPLVLKPAGQCSWQCLRYLRGEELRFQTLHLVACLWGVKMEELRVRFAISK